MQHAKPLYSGMPMAMAALWKCKRPARPRGGFYPSALSSSRAPPAHISESIAAGVPTAQHRAWQRLATLVVLTPRSRRPLNPVLNPKPDPVRRFILAEESSFFEAKFRSPEFSGADGSIELRDIDGATLVGLGSGSPAGR